MVINIFDSAHGVAVAGADQLAEAITARPSLVLGLAAGWTPVPIYAELKRRHVRGEIDCSRVTTFNLDEFVGGGGADRGSFQSFMQEHFFSGVNVAHSHFLNGRASDLDAECRRYESEIAQAGGIDVQILGIGTNGHIGFNEPGDQLIAATHQVALLPSTRQSNARLFGDDVARVPSFALTMGMGTILSAREVILVAVGERKASCIERLVNEGVTTRLPASLLQLHPRVSVFLDRSAAARLT